jgi:microcystin-dependent protein
MGTTPNFALPYPEPPAPPNVQPDIKALALAVDLALGDAKGMVLGAVGDWPWASAQLPSWTLLPYGQNVSGAAYPALQTLGDASGRPYGGAAGTNLTLPDYRGRIGAGKDDMGGTAANRITAVISGVSGATLGAVFGAEGITLTTAQLPSHTHTFTSGTESVDHSHSGTTAGRNAAHVHYFELGYNPPDDQNRTFRGGQGVYNGTMTGMTGESADHAHTFTSGGRSAAHTHSGTTDSLGTGSAHQNSQPSIIVNKFMRVL